MLRKNLIALAIIGASSSIGFASHASTSTPLLPSERSNNYVELLAGYNRYDFDHNYLPSIHWTHGKGNWAFGGDTGYQFNRYFAAEIGAVYTLTTKASDETLSPPVTNVRIHAWYTYAAGKVSIPISKKLSVFTKLGAGYQKLKMGRHEVLGPNDTTHKWGPMFGAGVAYYVTPKFYITGQWLQFAGRMQEGASPIPYPNIFLLGIGCKFSM